MCCKDHYTPHEVGIALSLYAFNVSPLARASKIMGHFEGRCPEIEGMINLFETRGDHAVTELPFSCAEVYVQHALDRYGGEARARVEDTERITGHAGPYPYGRRSTR